MLEKGVRSSITYHICLLGHVTDLFNLRTSELLRSQVPQNKVIIRTASGELITQTGQSVSKSLGVRADLLGIQPEFGGDGVVVRPALVGGEYSLVDAIFKVILPVFAEEDETGAWATQSLVSSGCDDVTEVEGIRGFLTGHEARDVGDVGHEVSAVEVSDFAETGVVPFTRVGRSTADEELGTEEEGVALESIIVDQTGLVVNLIGHGFEVDGGRRYLLLGSLVAVGQVAAGSELQAHETVMGLDQSSESRKVGGRARVGLDVDTPDFGIQMEGFQSTLAADVFDLIDVLVTAIVSGTRETFRIFVGQRGCVGFHNRERGEVL
ncbi:hypothetical protein BC937DRAFT_89717 [Endogone sp. FLAS-F59071]|nr:hypothetical protein BC937DRAFT_89717 [Endogone sp. FLAS-F59071]|eukprot:RUS23247.1 hypothetical protein BC937DRAFT_89717 [Endogone sp. FLAS-F59071]